MLSPIRDVDVEQAGPHDENPNAKVDRVQQVVEEQGFPHSGD